MKNKNIIFINTLNVDEIYAPTPAAFEIPQWYKDTPSYKDNLKKPDSTNNIPSTVKRCMPVFDSMSSGYIIKSYVDVYVSQKYGYPFFEWPSLSPISFHPIEQAEKHPKQNGIPYPKWVNSWAVKTPPGYSCLFTTPMHRENLFEILPGIVDTDNFENDINTPMLIKNNFEGIIKKGTPMFQIIPIKRESWESDFVLEKPNQFYFNMEKLKTTIVSSYSRTLRVPKNYK